MAGSPVLHRRAACKVLVGGRDVTDRLDPHLISVQVIDKMGDIDVCTIELDDRDGRLEVPSDKIPIQVWLGWAASGPNSFFGAPPPEPPGSGRQLRWEGSDFSVVFQGRVHNIESGFARGGGGGRRMYIEAFGSNMTGKGKSANPFKSWGEGEVTDSNGEAIAGVSGIPLSQVFEEAAKAAGYNGVVGPTIGNTMRDYWIQSHESFHSFGDRLAAELGGFFKIQGNTAMIVGKGEGVNPVTQNGWETIKAEWGVNLLSWRIKPYIGRPQWSGGRQVWFDIVNHKWQEAKKEFGQGSAPFTGIDAITQLPMPAPNKAVGDQSINGQETDSVFERGTGWCIINGEPKALAGANLIIIGARQGVDATYKISEAEHNYIRTSGYTTRCTLKRPGDFQGQFPDGLGVGRN